MTPETQAAETEEQRQTEQILDEGVLLAWRAVDASHLERGTLWYLTGGVLSMLLILYAIFTQAWTFAVLVAVLAGVVYLLAQEPAHEQKVIVTRLGIHINKKYYPFQQIKSFWFISEPGYSALCFQLHGKLAHTVRVSMADENPATVREVLGAELQEAPDRGELLIDTLARRFKL